MQNEANKVTGQLQPPGRIKKILFRALVVVALYAILDTVSYAILRIMEGRGILKLHGFDAASFFDEPRRTLDSTHFHPRWGWDIPQATRGRMGNRKGRTHETKKEYKMKVFGDSFVYGAGGVRETFEYFIEEQTGWACLNFGVEGYGTDQALLKYKGNGVKTKFTLLCIMDENIARCVNICRGVYYSRGESIRTKPRFIVSRDGSVTLMGNPVGDITELKKLKDVRFLKELGKYDYWAGWHRRRGTPSAIRWPATAAVLSNFGFFAASCAGLLEHKVMGTYDSYLWRAKYHHLYVEGSEGHTIMRHIVEDFLHTAAQRKETPVVVIFPTLESLEIMSKFGKKPYDPLVKCLEETYCSFVDFGDVFAGKDFAAYYRKDGHFNKRGNQVVAERLIRLVQQLEGN